MQPLDDGQPGRMPGLDDVEVIGAAKLDELGIVPGCSRRLHVGAALAWRDGVVPIAVNEQLRNADWEQCCRRGGGIALGHLGR